ncbi:OPT family oligopeptide transporter, partial [Streptomyces daliensis]|nr:OPT family oligopeptide transporter [Streptomyces daliensis]
AGWLVLAALAIRVVYGRYRRRKAEQAAATRDSEGEEVRAAGEAADNDLALIGAGLVAGSSINDVSQIYKAV